MKRSSFITMNMRMAGCSLFAIGMCLIMSHFILGIVVCIAGIILPMVLIPLISGLK